MRLAIQMLLSAAGQPTGLAAPQDAREVVKVCYYLPLVSTP
jgi:hypothetical protein